MKKIGKSLKKVCGCLLAAAMLVTAFAGTAPFAGTEAEAAEVKSVTIQRADSLEAGKSYVFLTDLKNAAMGCEQGGAVVAREAVEVSVSGSTLTYTGDAGSIIWTAKTGPDGNLKLYSRNLLDAGRNAFLRYSGCDMTSESGSGGEQHAYDAANHLLYSWYGSNSPWYVYFNERFGDFRKSNEHDESSVIYAYEVVSCAHENIRHHEAVPALCETAGTIEYWECEDCGEIFGDAALTVSLSDSGLAVPATGHDWDDGVVTKEATATERGVITYTCRNDPSHTKIEYTDPLGQDPGNIVRINPDPVSALENGKTYIFMSYPKGGQAISSQVKTVAESSGSYPYLAPAPVTISGSTAVFGSEEDAALCRLTAEENPSAKGQFRLRNDYGSPVWIYKSYMSIRTTQGQEEASWFTYSKNQGLRHTNSELVSSYPYITYKDNVYKGWTSVTSPVTVYEVTGQTEICTVNFETNGGTQIAPVTVTSGGTVEKPADPERENYTFAGWYADQACTAAYDFSAPVQATMTLYAKWERADGQTPVVYVQRVMAMRPGQTYLVVDQNRTLAMSTSRGNTLYDNTRGGKKVTVASADGKTTVTFAGVEEKESCLWTSAAGEKDGEVSLANGGELLGTYYNAAHYPAETDSEGALRDNIYFYADGFYLRAADSGKSICYKTSTETTTGFAPNDWDTEIYLYEVVDADSVHTHTFVRVPEQPATCEKDGVAEYYRCYECGQLSADKDGTELLSKPQTIPATGHSYGEWTRLDENRHQRVCAHDASHTEQAEHRWDAGVVTKEPTETQEGEMTFTCRDCHAVRTEKIAVKTGECEGDGSAGYLIAVTAVQALEPGKQYIITSADSRKAMTSENIQPQYGGFRLQGTDITYQADDERIVFASGAEAAVSVWDSEGADDMIRFSQNGGYLYNDMAYIWCGDEAMYDGDGGNTFAYTWLDERGYGRLLRVNSTSYGIGYDSGYGAFCANTDLACIVYRVDAVIGLNAGGSHNLVKHAAKAADCTHAGHTEYYECSKCHKLYADERGAVEVTADAVTIAPPGHALVLTAAKAAGCEEDGNAAYYTCSRCGLHFADAQAEKEIEKDSWVIEATGHDWDMGKITTEPGCTEPGVRTYTCKNDPAHTRTETVEPIGHQFVIRAHFDATCTEDGYDLYRCLRCGEEEQRNIKKATGHTYGDWTVIKEATADREGIRQRVCRDCGDIQQETIPKTEHRLFTDVTDPDTQFYFDYVYWAADAGIVTGWDDGTFRPLNDCNRAAVVTFLWRLAGRPEPSGIADFTDMPADTGANQDFRMAISWASEQGIVTGWDDNTFRPWNKCNRAAIVTFLWRYAERPEPSGIAAFTDMPGDTEANRDFRMAISWAAEQEITTGWDDNTFRPWNTCKRLAVVSFLYRYQALQ